MMTLYTATRRHVIKIDFMYLIIQCKIFHVINFRFLRKNENILTTKKTGSTECACVCVCVCVCMHARMCMSLCECM